MDYGEEKNGGPFAFLAFFTQMVWMQQCSKKGAELSIP